MCRILLGVNHPVDKKFLINFLSQSINKKNTPGIDNYLDNDYHLDGYGFIYGNLYKKLNIIKSPYSWFKECNINKNLNTIIKSKPKIIIGHLRYKGDNEGYPSIDNTHPFYYKDFIIVHNGKIKDFKCKRNEILKKIDNKYKKEIKGSTDTEFLFYLILTTIDLYLEYYKNKSYSKSDIYLLSFMTVFDYLIELDIKLVGNFIFSDSNNIIIIRYIASNFKSAKEPLSLYFGHGYSSNDIVISSEPLTTNYKIFPKNSYLII